MEEIKTRYIHDDLKKMRVFRDSILQTFWRMDGSSGMHYHCATSAITWIMATLPVFKVITNRWNLLNLFINLHQVWSCIHSFIKFRFHCIL